MVYEKSFYLPWAYILDFIMNLVPVYDRLLFNRFLVLKCVFKSKEEEFSLDLMISPGLKPQYTYHAVPLIKIVMYYGKW